MKLVLLSFIFLTLSCVNTDNQNAKIKTLHQVSGPITHLDPQIASGLASSLQLSKVYESLYEIHPYDGPYKILNSLALAMPKISNNGKTYLIKLKKGVLYHHCECLPKNRTIKAQDFVTTIKRIADPKLMSPHFSYWNKYILGMSKWREQNQNKDKTDYNIPLLGVTAIDEHTLEIKLKDSYSDFIYLLTGPSTSPIPIEALKYFKNDFSARTVGSGPFILTKYIRNSRLLFHKNKNFRKKYFPTTSAKNYQSYIEEYGGRRVPFLDRIEVKIIKESQTAWLNFLAGKVDYLEVAKDNFSEVFSPSLTMNTNLSKKGIKVGSGKAHSNLYYLGLNQLSPALSNKKVRQAMAYAFDYDKFNKLFFNNTAVIARSILPPGITGNNPPLKTDYKKSNIEKAKRLLKESGVKVPSLKMLVKNKTISRQVGAFFKKQMAQIGINIEVSAVSWQALMSDAGKGKFDIFYLAWFVGLPKGLDFFELMYGPNHPGSYNRVGYHNEEFDKLFDHAKRESNLEKQNSIIRRMNSIVSEELPIIPLVHTKNFFVHHKWLKNYVPTDQIGGLEQYYDLKK